jgi:hypothetical protein
MTFDPSKPTEPTSGDVYLPEPEDWAQRFLRAHLESSQRYQWFKPKKYFVGQVSRTNDYLGNHPFLVTAMEGTTLITGLRRLTEEEYTTLKAQQDRDQSKQF